MRADLDARMAALRQLVAVHDLDAVLISRAAHKRYYSGFRLGRGEESTSGYAGSLLVTASETLVLADSRYTEQAEKETSGWAIVPTTLELERELPPLLADRAVVRLGLEAQAMSHATWSALAAAAPGVELHAFDEELVPLRSIKTADEVDAIGRACALTDACFEHLLGFVRPGMTEDDVAWELIGWFRANGAEDLAFEPLVLAGPRAAMPHGKPSATGIEPGNVLLIDFGCQVDGYRSDMTRTVFIGEPSDELRRWYTAVREAQQLAIDALRPGVNGQEIDAIARERIAREGVEPYGHGLGHGIGLETHEPPALRRTKPYRLDVGMVFSVEPGIYLPGVTGIRIEDIVVLEDVGARMLTLSSRDIAVI
ncbi:MAG: M24 family metallopeptidase [Candidatus Limnocylindria bacterium]